MAVESKRIGVLTLRYSSMLFEHSFNNEYVFFFFFFFDIGKFHGGKLL